jgi:anti-sigma factor RsiW
MKHDEHLSEETVNLYLDGELGEDERTRVEAHLSACTVCQAEVDSLQELFFALKEMADAPAPNMVPGVVARVRPRTELTSLPWVIPALQGAAAVGLVACGWVRLMDYLTVAARALPLEALEQTEARALEWLAIQWSALGTWSNAAWAEAKAQMTWGLPFSGLNLPVTGLVVAAALVAIMWLVGNALLLGRIMYGERTAQPV